MASDRRTRFREYMRRFDPTGDPLQAVEAGFYVTPPGAVSERIATRLELQPASSHLLWGGIGSGKSTELIMIERRLAPVEDMFPVRIDVPGLHRLEKLKPGVLVALAALEACNQAAPERGDDRPLEEPIARAVARVSKLIRGRWDFPENDFDDERVWVPGVLEAPEASTEVEELSDALRTIQGALVRKLVVLFDGLDRVADLEALASVLAEDVPALGRAGVGCVVVGPQSLRFSPQRFVEKEFETANLHGAAGLDDGAGHEFLIAVLRARAGEDILPPESAAALARWSGGLVRDLVALARAAGAEAYAGGAETIAETHVAIARDRFGRDLVLGCTKEMTLRLRDLAPKKAEPPGAPRYAKAFTVATEVDQRLVTERLIIEVPGTPVRYVLHPTIVPLVAGLAAA